MTTKLLKLVPSKKDVIIIKTRKQTEQFESQKFQIDIIKICDILHIETNHQDKILKSIFWKKKFFISRYIIRVSMKQLKAQTNFFFTINQDQANHQQAPLRELERKNVKMFFKSKKNEAKH